MQSEPIPDEVMREARAAINLSDFDRAKIGYKAVGALTLSFARALLARDKRAAEIADALDPNAHDIAAAILTYKEAENA